jgi:RES domain-containing protein
VYASDSELQERRASVGLAKTMWMESQERGWDAPEKNLCKDCVSDPYLKEIVEDNVVEEVCDYCGAEAEDDDPPIAAPVECILGPIAAAVFRHYADPSEASVPWDEGAYIGADKIEGTEGVLFDLQLDCHDNLFQDIADSFHNTGWYPCAGGFWLNEHKHTELMYSWEDFVEQVKHRSRFFFGAPKLLEQIGEMAEQLDLIKTLPANTSLYRVRRVKPGGAYATFDDMGPPPPDAASAGRMNPAGISYFYLAFEDETAIAEVIPSAPAQAAVATFRSKTDLIVLDLSKLPDLPSIFNEGSADERETLLFLRGFVQAITAQVAKDGREHVDYVPSQVVSEFFAQQFRTLGGAELNGVIYPSAVRPAGVNIVVFPPRSYKPLLTDWFDMPAVEIRGVKEPHKVA